MDTVEKYIFAFFGGLGLGIGVFVSNGLLMRINEEIANPLSVVFYIVVLGVVVHKIDKWKDRGPANLFCASYAFSGGIAALWMLFSWIGSLH